MSSMPNFVVQKCMTGVLSFLASLLTCFQNSSRLSLTSQEHPAPYDCSLSFAHSPHIAFAFSSDIFDFPFTLKHPYGKSHRNKSIDLSGRFFIISRQSPRCNSIDILLCFLSFYNWIARILFPIRSILAM